MQGAALRSRVGVWLIVFEYPVGCGQEELPLALEHVQLGVEAELGVGFREFAQAVARVFLGAEEVVGDAVQIDCDDAAFADLGGGVNEEDFAEPFGFAEIGVGRFVGRIDGCGEDFLQGNFAHGRDVFRIGGGGIDEPHPLAFGFGFGDPEAS